MLKKLKPTIAILDSGLGGVSVLNALISKFHSGNYIYFADNLYMPYGKRTKQFVAKRMDKIIKQLSEKYLADKIIIACNTASTSIEKRYDDVLTLKFNENETYLATPLTKKNLPEYNIVADSTLARFIEKYIDNEKKLTQVIKSHIKKLNLTSKNRLVLACTHFELVADIFKKLLPNTEIINNSSFLIDNFEFNTNTSQTCVEFLCSKQSKQLQDRFFSLIRR